MWGGCMLNHLTVGCWNIQGLYEKVNSVKLCKLDETIFLTTLKSFDVLCLQETHVSQEEIIPIFEDFRTIPHCRDMSNNNRYFGGMLIFIRKSMEKGIKIGKNYDKDTFEITLLKNFFVIRQDIRILFTYASPINSGYTKSRAVNILDKIETDVVDGGRNYIVMGDLNGRTKLGDDFVKDNFDKHSPINIPYYEKDTHLERSNSDTHPIDQQGRKILDLCKTSAYRILNGRTRGDMEGNFTRFPVNLCENPSVIDYSLCNVDLLTEIHSFTVLPFVGLSDHCCIALNIRAKVKPADINLISPNENDTTIQTNKYEYSYDKRKKQIYEQNLAKDRNIDILDTSLRQGEINTETIDKNISDLNEIMMAAARKTFPLKKIKNSKNVKKEIRRKKTQGWFTKECSARRKVFRKYSRLMSKTPFNRESLHLFVKARAAYKQTCRKAERAYRQSLTKQLMDVGRNDPKTFWNIINKMNNWGKQQTDPSENISPKTWSKYFKELLNQNTESMFDTIQVEQVASFNPMLDGTIKQQELREALSELKAGKTPGPDGIYAECLKIFGEKYEPTLLQLVKRIFASHIYPSRWTINFLKPIHKKGDPTDPGNYRGLSIGSALAKLYSLIMLKRLANFMNNKKLLSPNQIGFMKGACTSDHIFLLQTIIEKIVKKGKKRLFVAFIDFKKAYDKVNRDILLNRLKELGINGIFLKNIESMYKQTLYSIKFKNGHLEPLNSNLGLKQGCPLSPMLFNLYIDDIKYVFDEQCDPVPLSDIHISHFLYADDLVILSQSRTGLQRCLDKLHFFSLKKHLKVSIDKSKSIVFNTAGTLVKESFTLDGAPLEPVQSFCYLGFEVKASGTVKHALNTLHDKANKAMRPLLCAISRFNIPVKMSISLFHTYVAPIMLYNVENCTSLSDRNLQSFTEDTILKDRNDSPINNIHKKFLKYVLGVNKSSPNISVMGETGEIPLSIKAYRLMINYWHRIRELPEETLVKKALLENTTMRTNWIRTIEKVMNMFEIRFTEHSKKFKAMTRNSCEIKYVKYWDYDLKNSPVPRLDFYKNVKVSFGYEKYLDITNIEWRKCIAKLRCSSHVLQVEKGRHINQPREQRLCRLCNLHEIETEEHFLLRCTQYNNLRNKYNMNGNFDSNGLITNTQPCDLGQYISEAFNTRKVVLECST